MLIRGAGISPQLAGLVIRRVQPVDIPICSQHLWKTWCRSCWGMNLHSGSLLGSLLSVTCLAMTAITRTIQMLGVCQGKHLTRNSPTQASIATILVSLHALAQGRLLVCLSVRCCERVVLFDQHKDMQGRGQMWSQRRIYQSDTVRGNSCSAISRLHAEKVFAC